MTITFVTGSIYIDWVARDREIRRQMNEGIINLDKIYAAAKRTYLP